MSDNQTLGGLLEKKTQKICFIVSKLQTNSNAVCWAIDATCLGDRSLHEALVLERAKGGLVGAVICILFVCLNVCLT